MEYQEINGNLFRYKNSHVLVHCIASDAIMGAGIAKQFRKQTDVSEIDKMAQNGQLEVGKAYLSKQVIHLVTKESSYGKPTRIDFNRALFSMRRLIDKHGIKKIAMPLIGSGLDRLDWSTTRHTIENVFKDTDVEITICKL